MNPLTNVKNLNKINDRELEMGIAGTRASWHWEYRDSAWIFIGGLPYDLTEGDVISVFSQYGEIVHINLVRDMKTGKSKGFCFLCYEDQRSTILSVDNLNGIKVCKRTIRVDHVHTYKLPKDLERMDEDKKKLFLEGCAPKPITPDPASKEEEEEEKEPEKEERTKHKKEKKKKKKKKRKRDSSSSSSTEEEKERTILKKKKRKKKRESSSSSSSEDDMRKKKREPSSDEEDKRMKKEKRRRRSPTPEKDKRNDHDRRKKDDRRSYSSRYHRT